MPGAMQNFGLIRAGTGTAVLREIPIPELGPGYILVRTVAVALNPTDWTSLDAIGDPGTIVGCDYAGIVEQVGSGGSNRFKKGDRIAGFAHGANDANAENGAFARYIAVKEVLQMHIPENVIFEAAATTGVGIGSAGYGLYKVLGLLFPDSTASDNSSQTEARGSTVLIYGGSTATGSIAIQLAKLSGLKVAVTCSPKHFELLRKRGADLVYDYRDPKVGERIRADTGASISKVFDTVSTESTAAICAEAIGPDGGIYCNLLGIDCPRADVQSIFFLGYSMSGEAYIFEGEKMEAQPEDFDFGSKWYGIAESLWAQGKWTPHPQRIEGGGLLGINDGLQHMRESKVSGEKLVYRVDDTVWPY